MQLTSRPLFSSEEFELFGPPHPGEVLREDLLPRSGLTKQAFAKHLGISRSLFSQLIHAKRPVSREIARRLGEACGTGTLYWLVLQAHYDAWSAERTADPVRSAVQKIVWAPPVPRARRGHKVVSSGRAKPHPRRVLVAAE